MSDEKNVNSADSADQSASQKPAPQPASGPTPEAKADTPKSAALSRAEQKAAKATAKAEAKLDRVRAKEAEHRAKLEARSAAKAEKAEKAEQEATAKEQAKNAPKSAQNAKAPIARQPENTADSAAGSTGGPAVPEAKPAGTPGAAQQPADPKPAAAQSPAGIASPQSAAAAPAPSQPDSKGDGAGAGEQKEAPASGEKSESAAKAKHSAVAATGTAAGAAAAVSSGQESAVPKPAEGKPAAAAKDTAAKDTAGSTPAQAGKAEPQEPGAEDPHAAKRRRKLEKLRAHAASKEALAAQAGAAAAAAPEPADSKVSQRRRKLDKAREAATKDAAAAPNRKKTGAVLLSLAAVVAAGAVVGAGSIFAPHPADKTLPAAVTNLPAGDARSVCAATPQLLKGVDGTDPQFAPGAKDISSNLRSIAVSDLAKRIPGSSFANVDGSKERELTKRIPDEEAIKARGADDQGLSGSASKVSTAGNLDQAQVFSLQPLGEIASKGSALRSYQAKDGDLAGLAAATCQAPASNWRFTGLQTSTGSTSVMHLANPTHTTAQVSLRLRGPDGLIDTSTLQNVVLAPGETRAIVLGGYAQSLDSVSAEVTSVGGKITASVQQAALRGLTPSGVELVGANASASNSQVIPGVWIESKENISELSKDDNTLVPQLHVSATGSSGAGYTVKVLGKDGEVAASFEDNLAVASNATSIVDLKQLPGGYYTVVVESDAPVTAAVRMVRGANPEDSSDTAWAASSNVLAGTQAMPLSANGTGKFALAAVDADSSVEAVVVNKDGSMEESKKLQIEAGQSIVFDPKSVSADAQAVIFSTDANSYVAQLILGSDRSIAWAAMPQANAGRDGIVVNIGG